MTNEGILELKRGHSSQGARETAIAGAEIRLQEHNAERQSNSLCIYLTLLQATHIFWSTGRGDSLRFLKVKGSAKN